MAEANDIKPRSDAGVDMYEDANGNLIHKSQIVEMIEEENARFNHYANVNEIYRNRDGINTINSMKLKIGDKVDPRYFNLKAKCSFVTVTNIQPYANGNYCNIVRGTYKYKGQEFETEPIEFSHTKVVMIKKTSKPIAYENINLKLSNLELNALLGLTFEYKKNLNNKNDSFSEREKQVIKKLEKSIIEAQILIEKRIW